MGIGLKEALHFVDDLKIFENKTNVSICELGNNYLKGAGMTEWLKNNNIDISIGGQQHKKGYVSKKFWEALGFKHTSIDLNGYDGSLMYDLRYPLPSKFGKFDIIYDGGTGEHIDNQYSLFKNVHNITENKYYTT